jgi:hypothetical protein
MFFTPTPTSLVAGSLKNFLDKNFSNAVMGKKVARCCQVQRLKQK